MEFVEAQNKWRGPSASQLERMKKCLFFFLVSFVFSKTGDLLECTSDK